MKVDRWACLIVLLAVLALAAIPLTGCGDDDDDDDDDDSDDHYIGDDDDATPDDDDDDTVDDDTSDDDTGDDDTADDDTTEDTLEITPWAEMIPAGTDHNFGATGTIDGEPVDDGFTWSIDDEDIATVDANGTVTGIADGMAVLTAAIGEASAEAYALVGPDIYVLDNQLGLLMGIDRGAGTAIADLLATEASIAVVLNDIVLDPNTGLLAMVDSGDSGAGITGDEKLIVVDMLDDLALTNITLNQDSPWSVAMLDGVAFITGNLDDTLAKIDLTAKDPTPTYFDLDDGCVPTDIIGIDGYVYITCSGFDSGTFTYEPGKVLKIDAATGTEAAELILPQVNPNNFALAPDGSLYVVCTGNYVDELGVVAQIDLSDFSVADSFALGSSPGPIGINDDGIGFVGEGMAGSMYVFDSADNSVIHGDADPIAIPSGLWVQAVGVHNDTGDAYVCDQFNGKVYVIDGDDYSLGETPYELTNPGGVTFW